MLRFHETPRQRVRLECLRLAMPISDSVSDLIANAGQLESFVFSEPQDGEPATPRVEHFPDIHAELNARARARGWAGAR